MEPNFLKRFLLDNNLKAVDVYTKTGNNKNTFTKWFTLKDDAMLPQTFILTLIKEFPDIDLTQYFPCHAEIIRCTKPHNK